MSVLPSSATFASFFVVVVIFFIITILLGLNLSKLLTATMVTVQSSYLWLESFLKPVSWTRSYVQSYVDMLATQEREPHFNMLLYSCRLRDFFIAFMRDFLIPEILVPRVLWNRFLYRNNRYINFW